MLWYTWSTSSKLSNAATRARFLVLSFVEREEGKDGMGSQVNDGGCIRDKIPERGGGGGVSFVTFVSGYINKRRSSTFRHIS